MKLSKKSEYGLRALLELTLAYETSSFVQRQDIASRQNIPVEFLEQVLLTLKRAGLLASRRGMNGGYRLIKPPSHVTLGQVIRILDGPLAPIGCVSRTAYQKCDDCPYAGRPSCPVQQAMGAVRDAIAGILDHYSLTDFAAGARNASS
ncbi:MAG: Rrf2 family transcriptional regulator [Nitrospira sp.]|nr:Rrf2 family transcriptional regulator [Nitrospira sp.]MCP9463277.1 Rrf2 family transcriptional regulator [Nitrospira sp.]